MTKVDPNPGAVSPLGTTLLRLVASAAWVGTAMLLGFVALRVLHLDDTPVVATAQALTLYLLLPAWGVLGFAWTTRRRALGAAAAVVALAQVVWTVPEVRAATPAPPGQAPRLRVFSANLLYRNTRIAELAEEIRASGADLVLLQEYDRANREAIESSGALAAYPYRSEHREDSPFGALIASRAPLLDASVIDIGGIEMPRAVLATAIGPVEVVCVHTKRPVTAAEHDGWVAEHEALAVLVRSRVHPLVLAGDFNATTAHRPFRDLLDAGIVDAHRARGDGLSNSWPRDRHYPPLVRIDHVLATAEIAVAAVHNGTGRGSDHIPVRAELALVGTR